MYYSRLEHGRPQISLNAIFLNLKIKKEIKNNQLSTFNPVISGIRKGTRQTDRLRIKFRERALRVLAVVKDLMKPRHRQGMSDMICKPAKQF